MKSDKVSQIFDSVVFICYFLMTVSIAEEIICILEDYLRVYKENDYSFLHFYIFQLRQ